MASEAEVLEEEPGLDRTLSLIDAFLATVPEEVSGQTSLDYSMDYTTYLLQEDEEDSSPEQSEIPKLRGHELIDGFIERSEGETSIRLQPAANNETLPVEEEGEAHHEEDENEARKQLQKYKQTQNYLQQNLATVQTKTNLLMRQMYVEYR